MHIYAFCNISPIISGNTGLDWKNWTASTYISIYFGYSRLFFFFFNHSNGVLQVVMETGPSENCSVWNKSVPKNCQISTRALCIWINGTWAHVNIMLVVQIIDNYAFHFAELQMGLRFTYLSHSKTESKYFCRNDVEELGILLPDQKPKHLAL